MKEFMGSVNLLDHFIFATKTRKAGMLELIESGKMSPEEKGIALLYSRANGAKDIFNALLQLGADPFLAIKHGSNDPRWDGAYMGVADWAIDYYEKNKASIHASAFDELKNVAYTKECRLSPGGNIGRTLSKGHVFI